MDSEKNNDKLKIFVSYLPGSGGHFISTLLLSLIQEIEIKEKHRYYSNIKDLYVGHNFSNQWISAYDHYTSPDIDLAEGAKWIQQKFTFYPTDRLYYVAHTHAINPKPLLLAFDNTKLINISITEEDSDQLSYNWLTKIFLLDNRVDIVNAGLQLIQQKHNKLKHITTVNENTDFKLLNYIHKFKSQSQRTQFSTVNFNGMPNVLTIKFNDIMSGQIKLQLDDIIKFIGINISKERKNKALTLINDYANTQKKVPWIQTIDEYN